MKLLGILLLPSWLSGLITVVASLVLVFGSIILLHRNDSSWQLVLPQQHQTSSPQVITGIEIPEPPARTNFLIDNLPLLIFWAGVGLIIYSFTMTIINAFSNISSLKQEMNYMHANRRTLLRQAAGRLLLRSIILLLWILYTRYSLSLLLPYTVALAYAGSGTLGLLYNIGYITAAVVLLVISLHLHAVLLRLLFLKPRLFGQVI